MPAAVYRNWNDPGLLRLNPTQATAAWNSGFEYAGNRNSPDPDYGLQI
jgi:hypothetical protein